MGRRARDIPGWRIGIGIAIGIGIEKETIPIPTPMAVPIAIAIWRRLALVFAVIAGLSRSEGHARARVEKAPGWVCKLFDGSA